MEGVRVNPISLNPDAEPRPMTDLSTEDPLEDPQDPRSNRLVEAQGWVIGPNGEVTPYSLEPRRKTCRLSD